METIVGYTIDLSQNELNKLVDTARDTITEWAGLSSQPDYSQFVDDLVVVEVIRELCRDFLNDLMQDWDWHLSGARDVDLKAWSILHRKVLWAAKQELPGRIR